MTPERLAKIKALADAATPGPWRASTFHGIDYEDGSSSYTGGVWDEDSCSVFITSGIDKNNAQFIAAARTDVPQLVAEVRRLQKAVNLHRRIRRWGNDDYSITDTTYQLALKHDPEEVADMTPFAVCEECYEVEDTIRQENDGDTLLGIRSYWPCPTIQALGENDD